MCFFVFCVVRARVHGGRACALCCLLAHCLRTACALLVHLHDTCVCVHVLVCAYVCLCPSVCVCVCVQAAVPLRFRAPSGDGVLAKDCADLTPECYEKAMAGHCISEEM